jgi:hypothetical protein
VVRAVLVAACALAAACPAGADAPACLAEAEVSPDEALVGEQVVYRLRLLTTAAVTSLDWVEPPSFPGARAEWLPGVRSERRALFPQRVGTLIVRAPDLRCALGGAEVVARVPPVEVRVRPAPGAEAPDGPALVGPLAVNVTVSSSSVRLGESVRIGVTLLGEGNVWDAPEPFPDDAAFAGAEVFRRRPDEVLEPGRRLAVRRRFAYDVVPRREGALRIPALRVPYLDPVTRRAALAQAAAVEVGVLPRAAAPEAGGPPTAGPSPAPPPAAGSARLARAALALLCVGLGVAGGIALLRRRRGASPVGSALADARAARARGERDAEAAALARALRAALARQVPGAERLAPEQIREAAPAGAAAAAARALEDLERARFDPTAPRPDPAAAERALAGLVS